MTVMTAPRVFGDVPHSAGGGIMELPERRPGRGRGAARLDAAERTGVAKPTLICSSGFGRRSGLGAQRLEGPRLEGTGILHATLAMCYRLTSKSLEDHVSNPSTTTLSSKGQVVIPEEIRERLGLTPGTRFVVVAEQDVVVFKVLQAPEVDEFAGLVAQARAVAREEGLRAADVRRAVREARRKA